MNKLIYTASPKQNENKEPKLIMAVSPQKEIWEKLGYKSKSK